MTDSEFAQMITTPMILFIFFLLVSTIPQGLFATSIQEYEIDNPDYYEGLDVSSYGATTNFTIDSSTFDSVRNIRLIHTWTLGGVEWVMTVDPAFSNIRLGRRNLFLVFWLSTDYLNFRDENGTTRGDFLFNQEMNLAYSTRETWIKYRMTLENDPNVGCDILLGFNDTLYSSPTEALINQALWVFQGLGLEDLLSTFNVWQLIGSIMFFQAPNVHPLLNGLIAIPLWFAFVYALTRFMLRAIPFVG